MPTRWLATGNIKVVTKKHISLGAYFTRVSASPDRVDTLTSSRQSGFMARLTFFKNDRFEVHLFQSSIYFLFMYTLTRVARPSIYSFLVSNTDVGHILQDLNLLEMSEQNHQNLFWLIAIKERNSSLETTEPFDSQCRLKFSNFANNILCTISKKPKILIEFWNVCNQLVCILVSQKWNKKIQIS